MVQIRPARGTSETNEKAAQALEVNNPGSVVNSVQDLITTQPGHWRTGRDDSGCPASYSPSEPEGLTTINLQLAIGAIRLSKSIHQLV